MGIGDSIRNAAENAMKDLGGTAEPHDDGHAPEPGAPDEEIKVHSSISEASNTMDAAEGEGHGGDPAGRDAQGGPAQGTEAGAGAGASATPAGEGDTDPSTGLGRG